MRILHYDCAAGISGDMNLAALIDLGVDIQQLTTILKGLHLHDHWELTSSRALSSGIEGTQVSISYEEHSHDHHDHGFAHSPHHHHRTFAQIKHILETSHLSDFVKKSSIRVFELLAEAEGKVHGKPACEVHFHEVGAVDSILDIVGSMVCLELLQVDYITATTVELGSGQVRCEHGMMSVPAPATAELSKLFPSSLGGTNHEATTPTGAAILAATVNDFNTKISGNVVAHGIGVGHRQNLILPNILRVMIVESSESKVSPISDKVELQANIDDMTGEQLAYLSEQLLENGALDVWQQPIVMKKGRLAHLVTLICEQKDKEHLLQLFFFHSTTLGIREYPFIRHELKRTEEKIATPLGPVNIKTSYLSEQTHHHKPEYEDCTEMAKQTGLNLKQCQLLATMQRLRQDAHEEEN